MKCYSSAQVANYFLGRGNDEGRAITMLKLIKICYIAHGWKLGLTGEPLIDEEVEAWQYGPVIPSLYHEFKYGGNRPIRAYAAEFDFGTQDIVKPSIERGDQETIEILAKVWDVYKTMNGSSLISKTHADDTPWKEFYEEGVKGKVIPNDSIQAHYETLLGKLVES